MATASWILATASWMLQIHIRDIMLCNYKFVLVALNLNDQLSSKVNVNQLIKRISHNYIFTKLTRLLIQEIESCGKFLILNSKCINALWLVISVLNSVGKICVFGWQEKRGVLIFMAMVVCMGINFCGV